MILVDRQIMWTTVDLSCAGKNDTDGGVDPATGLKKIQLRSAVDVQIRMRIGHRVHMTGLAGKIEEIVDARQQRLQRESIANVGIIDAKLILAFLQVEQITAILWYQAVDDRNPAPPGQPGDERAWTQ